MRPQLGAGVIDHIARLIDLLPRLRNLARERGGAAAHLIEQRERAGDPANGGPRLFDRVEKRRQRQEARRFERPALDREDVQNLRQVARGPQREPAMPGNVGRRLAGCRKLLGDLLRIGRGREPGEAFLAGRRQRETADRLDDAIEFEGPQNSWLHIEDRKTDRQSGEAGNLSF